MILKFINQGEYKKAKKNLLVIIEKDEGDAEAYNLLGYTERQLQNYISAIKFYKKALRYNYCFYFYCFNEPSFVKIFFSRCYLE